MTGFFAVLLFGRKKVNCILFEKSRGGASYFAEKSIEYEGYNEKDFINPEDVFLKVERLINGACDEYGVRIRTVYCALPSLFFRYGIAEKDLAIDGGVVTEKDVGSLLSLCEVKLPGYVPVEKLPLYYKSFNNPVMKDPVGQNAERLYVTASIGYLNTRVNELLDNCAKKLKLSFVRNSFASLVAKRLDYDYLSGVRRVVILFTEGSIDVVFAEGAVPVDVRTVAWGEDTIRQGVKELLDCNDNTCDILMKRLNLNLAFTDADVYRVYGKAFSVKEVNGFAAEAVEFFAKEVKKSLNGFPIDECAFYLTGCALCANRGVKELFEDELGKDVLVVSSNEPNLEGCDKYVVSSYVIPEKEETSSLGRLKKIFNRRK